MAQVISIAILMVAVAVFQAGAAARLAADGNWGEALGRLVFGPLVFFFLIQAVLYYGTKLVRGHMGHGFATSRLNYVSLAITLLGMLGRIAQEMPARLP